MKHYWDQDNPDLPRPVGTDIVHFSDYFEGAQKYLSYLKSTIDVNLEGLKSHLMVRMVLHQH